MQFLALLTTLCLSLASTYAAPIEPPPPEVLEVDDIDIRKWSEGNGTSYKISFQLRNPYPEANIEYHAITTCSGFWKEGANDYNTECANDAFSWDMEEFVSSEQFTMTLDHSYVLDLARDEFPHVGATAVVKKEDLNCHDVDGCYECLQKGETIEAQIDEMSSAIAGPSQQQEDDTATSGKTDEVTPPKNETPTSTNGESASTTASASTNAGYTNAV